MSQFIRKSLTDEDSWKSLKALHEKHAASLKMRDLFASDPERFNKYK